MGRTKRKLTKRLVVAISVIMIASTCFTQQVDPENINNKYRKIYPYMTYKDTVYTFESEFIFPEGYARPDSSSIPEFSNWVARMPIWFSYKSIGNWKNIKEKEYTEISRAVHLPWKGPAYKDLVFPVRILAEYFVYKNEFDSFEFIPKIGETVTFDKWLSGTPARKSGGEVIFRPAEKRESSLKEYYAFMNYTFIKLEYGTLRKNCDEVDQNDILPGDIYIASDSTGRKGKAIFIQNKLVSKNKEPLYIISHSGKEACDFHIPLVTEDRNNPWITVDEIIEYAGEHEVSGFYRFKVLND